MAEWAVRHSLTGKDLEENRAYNSNRDIHGEWIHPDRFRYWHEVQRTPDAEMERFTCGTKYDPDDVSGCPLCQAAKHGRTLAEAMPLMDYQFSFPRHLIDGCTPKEVMARWAQEAATLATRNDILFGL